METDAEAYGKEIGGKCLCHPCHVAPPLSDVLIPHGCTGSPGLGIPTIAAACSRNPQFDFPFPLMRANQVCEKHFVCITTHHSSTTGRICSIGPAMMRHDTAFPTSIQWFYVPFLACNDFLHGPTGFPDSRQLPKPWDWTAHWSRCYEHDLRPHNAYLAL